MTQVQDQTASSNGTDNKREVKVVTPVEAITKISKILDQLSPADRRRVLAFVSASGENGE